MEAWISAARSCVVHTLLLHGYCMYLYAAQARYAHALS
jgi:hypothetical protein